MKLLNYLFWWCGYLVLSLEVSFWWFLSYPLVLIGYCVCGFYLEDKDWIKKGIKKDY